MQDASQPLTRFIALLENALSKQNFTKATLGHSRGAIPTLLNLYLRPVQLKGGAHLQFVYRHTNNDLTQNYTYSAAIEKIKSHLSSDFFDAHLFTTDQTIQLTSNANGTSHLKTQNNMPATAPVATTPATHDRTKKHLIPIESNWLKSLGVTNDRNQSREGMAAKFRQINKFVELLDHLTAETELPPDRPFHLVDMGSGKGYLTFSAAAHFGDRAQVLGIEARPELVSFCNTAAQTAQINNLKFSAGNIASCDTIPIDILIALHACDTATDDALFQGIRAKAQLLVVSPCCHKEIRPQLIPPDLFAETLRHGIFMERHAELVTDSLRAQLLEYAGYRTKVFEFISTEHTAKNLMIAAVKTRPAGDSVALEKLTAFANHHGIRHQHLARLLGLSLS